MCCWPASVEPRSSHDDFRIDSTWFGVSEGLADQIIAHTPAVIGHAKLVPLAYT